MERALAMIVMAERRVSRMAVALPVVFPVNLAVTVAVAVALPVVFPVNLAVTMAVAVALARLCAGRGGQRERACAKDEKCLFYHDFLLEGDDMNGA